jgi:hypothetical protein
MPLFWRVDLDVRARSVAADDSYDDGNPAARDTAGWSLPASAIENAAAAIKNGVRGQTGITNGLLSRGYERIGLAPPRTPACWSSLRVLPNHAPAWSQAWPTWPARSAKSLKPSSPRRRGPAHDQCPDRRRVQGIHGELPVIEVTCPQGRMSSRRFPSTESSWRVATIAGNHSRSDSPSKGAAPIRYRAIHLSCSRRSGSHRSL